MKGSFGSQKGHNPWVEKHWIKGWQVSKDLCYWMLFSFANMTKRPFCFPFWYLLLIGFFGLIFMQRSLPKISMLGHQFTMELHSQTFVKIFKYGLVSRSINPRTYNPSAITFRVGGIRSLHHQVWLIIIVVQLNPSYVSQNILLLNHSFSIIILFCGYINLFTLISLSQLDGWYILILSDLN